ncbi:hypothetical protein NUW54_g6426 [Trametes sanguinea]|uniref:Uncharacterized protein n=1 Tax=Trametes sanguinea TaxID=158606 RepID=A0ACC1PST9_9APHY|nr:hypothetical protein NUW54_g6426 [Trametes sanguinea]
MLRSAPVTTLFPADFHSADASAGLLVAPAASDSPEEIKETTGQEDTKVADVEMRDAPAEPAPQVVVVDNADVKMADEEPTSHSEPPAPPRAASPTPSPPAPPARSGADLLFSLADAAVAARDMQPVTAEPQPAPNPEPEPPLPPGVCRLPRRTQLNRS